MLVHHCFLLHLIDRGDPFAWSYTGLLVHCIPVNATAGQLTKGIQPFESHRDSSGDSSDDAHKYKVVTVDVPGIPTPPSLPSPSTSTAPPVPICNVITNVVRAANPMLCQPRSSHCAFDQHNSLFSNAPYFALDSSGGDGDSICAGA